MKHCWFFLTLLCLSSVGTASPILLSGSGSFNCGWDWRTAPYGTPYVADVTLSFSGQDSAGNLLGGTADVSDVLQSGQSCSTFVPALNVSWSPLGSISGINWMVTLNYLGTQYSSQAINGPIVDGAITTDYADLLLKVSAGSDMLDMTGFVDDTNATATEQDVVFQGHNEGMYWFSSGTFNIDDHVLPTPEPAAAILTGFAILGGLLCRLYSRKGENIVLRTGKS